MQIEGYFTTLCVDVDYGCKILVRYGKQFQYAFLDYVKFELLPLCNEVSFMF